MKVAYFLLLFVSGITYAFSEVKANEVASISSENIISSYEDGLEYSYSDITSQTIRLLYYTYIDSYNGSFLTIGMSTNQGDLLKGKFIYTQGILGIRRYSPHGFFSFFGVGLTSFSLNPESAHWDGKSEENLKGKWKTLDALSSIGWRYTGRIYMSAEIGFSSSIKITEDNVGTGKYSPRHLEFGLIGNDLFQISVGINLK